MNNTRLLKKYVLLGIQGVVLILLTLGSCYGNFEEEEGRGDDLKIEDNVLFRFMRDNYRLESYAAALGLEIKDGEGGVLKDLPFNDLFQKLRKQLMNLAINEARVAVSKNTISDEMQAVMSELILDSGGGFDRMLMTFREKFKQYPNTADLVWLEASAIRDAKDILELASGSQEDDEAIRTARGKVLEMLFNDAVKGYKSFVKHNEDALKLIEKLADNDFRLKVVETNCTKIFGIESCKTETDEKDLKNFWEIMPYVMGIGIR